MCAGTLRDIEALAPEHQDAALAEMFKLPDHIKAKVGVLLRSGNCACVMGWGCVRMCMRASACMHAAVRLHVWVCAHACALCWCLVRASCARMCFVLVPFGATCPAPCLKELVCMPPLFPRLPCACAPLACLPRDLRTPARLAGGRAVRQGCGPGARHGCGQGD